MEKMDISIDFGGSDLRAVASSGETVIAFRIGPQVIDILDPKYLEQEFSIDLAQSLWVKSAGIPYALGDLAASQYYAPIPIIDPKRDYVIPRTLGAVAVAAHRLCWKKSFKVNLQLLLPAAEFNKEDKLQLRDELALALADFDTSNGPIKAKLFNFAAKPEGFGLMRRRLELAGAICQEQAIAVVMFGHRNTSLYLFAGGTPRHFKSNNIGFIRAIEYANVDQVKAIANPSLVDQNSLAHYWNANKRWIRENWPESATSVIIGGGPLAAIGADAVEYLEGLIQANQTRTNQMTFLHGGMPLTRHEERNFVTNSNPDRPLLSHWPNDMGISDEDKRQFADVYCLWATGQKVAVQASANAQ
jgi:hypothetical protein